MIATDDEWDEPSFDDALCWKCRGDCWVIVGTDIDCDDGVNGPFNGETIPCPCCNGSGKAKDETYW